MCWVSSMRIASSVSLSPNMLRSLMLALPTMATRSSTMSTCTHVTTTHHYCLRSPYLVVHVDLVVDNAFIHHSPAPKTKEFQVIHRIDARQSSLQLLNQGVHTSTGTHTPHNDTGSECAINHALVDGHGFVMEDDAWTLSERHVAVGMLRNDNDNAEQLCVVESTDNPL